MTEAQRQKSLENRRQSEMDPRRYAEADTEGKRDELRAREIIANIHDTTFVVEEASGFEDETRKIDFYIMEREELQNEVSERVRYAVQQKSRPMDIEEVRELIRAGIVPMEFDHEMLYNAVKPDQYEGELVYNINNKDKIARMSAKITYMEAKNQFNVYRQLVDLVKNGGLISDEQIDVQYKRFVTWREGNRKKLQETKIQEEHEALRRKFPQYFQEDKQAA